MTKVDLNPAPKPVTLEDIDPSTHIIAALLYGKPAVLKRHSFTDPYSCEPASWCFQRLSTYDLKVANTYGAGVYCGEDDWKQLIRELSCIRDLQAFDNEGDFYAWIGKHA